MTPIAVTDGTLQPLTAVDPAGPSAGLSIAGLSGQYGISLEVTNFSTTAGAGSVRIACTDTVNAFTAEVVVAEWSFSTSGPEGGIQPGASIREYKSNADAPSLRIGVTSAAMRFTVTQITGTGASVSFNGCLWN